MSAVQNARDALYEEDMALGTTYEPWQSTRAALREGICGLDRAVGEGDLLEAAIRHVLRYGRLGKQSERRLRAALRAFEVSRGVALPSGEKKPQ